MIDLPIHLKSGAAVLVMATALASAAPSAAAEQGRAPAEEASSLYARLGGYDFIARFVDAAFPRVAGHAQLRRFFQGHSHDSQLRQRQLIIEALCQGTGGPCVYIGRAMKPVHVGLGITPADWTVFIGILGGALEELSVQPQDRKDFLHLLEGRFKPDVIEGR